MSDPLSQKEIDWLVEGRGPEGVATARQEAVPYSFRRPPRIPKDRQILLDGVHSKFAQSLQAQLSDRLREPIEISVACVEQVDYSEFLLSLSRPCALYVFRLRNNGQELGIFDLGTGFAFHAIDRMLGGPGEASGPERGLTRLEQDIAARIAGLALNLLRDAWGGTDLTLDIKGFESDPDLLQVMRAEEPIMLLLLNIATEKIAGQMMIGLPAVALDALCESYGTRPTDRPDAAEVLTQAPLESGMRQVKMAVSVQLPLVSLLAGSILKLKEGDLIDTGHPLDTPFEVHLNGRPIYAGSLGQIHRRFGLKVTRAVKRPASGRWEQGKEGKVQ